MTELREEGGSMLETLLTLIASHTISRLVNWCCHSHGLFTATNQNISLNLIKLFVINRKPQNKSKMWIYSCLYLLSVNLMAALGSLSAIARQRPAFMAIVVQAFESLHGIVRLSYNYSECVAGKMLSSKLTLQSYEWLTSFSQHQHYIIERNVYENYWNDHQLENAMIFFSNSFNLQLYSLRR